MTRFSIKKCEYGLWALEVIKTETDDLFGLNPRGMEICKLENTLGFLRYVFSYWGKNEYPEMYRKCLKITRKDALSALYVSTLKKIN